MRDASSVIWVSVLALMMSADGYIISLHKLEDVLRIQMDVSLGLYVTGLYVTPCVMKYLQTCIARGIFKLKEGYSLKNINTGSIISISA